MKQMTALPSAGVQIDIPEKQAMILFPNHPAVCFSWEVPDIYCAGYSPTITPKGWLWCAYNNALTTGEIELEEETSLVLFRLVWSKVEKFLMA